MSNALVRVPWQPQYYVTPDTLALLVKASSIAGHNIILDDAWRSYAEQKYYWDAYMAGWGNPAANPDTGQRNHMRGAAVDIVNKSDRDAMLKAGFTPDGSEWWHFNNPNWQNMPIIPDATGLASTSSQPIGDDMSLTPADISLLLNFPAYDHGPTISQLLKNNAAILSQPVQRTIDGKVVNVAQIQDNADTNTMVRDIVSRISGPIDYDELAKALLNNIAKDANNV